MMIRKLEHERDKLSNQLEKSQEAASHAKKMAKEGEMAIKSATANCTRLENELNRLAQARFQFQKTLLVSRRLVKPNSQSTFESYAIQRC